METHYDFCEVRAEYLYYVPFFSIQTAEFIFDVSKKQLLHFSKIYLENNQKLILC